MKFALTNHIKTEATKGATGICPGCGADLIAKCGEAKVHHWAHKGARNCDEWWENETAWHRTWKNHFPVEWQESVAINEINGEKHIADVRTAHGLVIEFQHSFLKPEERRQRESFYKKMIWIVDGSRLKNDYPRFRKAVSNFRKTDKQGHFLVHFPEEYLPSNWLDSTVPVIFDFRGDEIPEEPKDLRHHLYYLYPKKNGTLSLLAIISRNSLINDIISGELFKATPAPTPEVVQRSVSRYITTNNTVKRSSGFLYDRGKFIKRHRF